MPKTRLMADGELCVLIHTLGSRRIMAQTIKRFMDDSQARQCTSSLDSHITMRFGSTAKVLAKCKLKYYRISEWDSYLGDAALLLHDTAAGLGGALAHLMHGRLGWGGSRQEGGRLLCRPIGTQPAGHIRTDAALIPELQASRCHATPQQRFPEINHLAGLAAAKNLL